MRTNVVRPLFNTNSYKCFFAFIRAIRLFASIRVKKYRHTIFTLTTLGTHIWKFQP